MPSPRDFAFWAKSLRGQLITFSFRNNMNRGAGDQFLPYEYPQYPPGWIYPLPGTCTSCFMIEEIPAHLLRPRVLSRSLPESLQFSEDSSMPTSIPFSSRRASSSAENKKWDQDWAQDRWSREEEKLLVQLWAEKHGVVFCSQILFLSATVALRTNFLSLADFKSDLSRANLKLPNWPIDSSVY